jgi:A/G-specific adenine glycosylase
MFETLFLTFLREGFFVSGVRFFPRDDIMKKKGVDPMNERDFPMFRAKMLAWFDIHRREMPWRTEKTPYRVWISEVMLQQTRVDTVIPYFERFIARFPSVARLAEATDDRLLKAWEGLGYYNRVRNLKKAAVRLMEERGGVLPETAGEWATLPGIGPYASGSIASIAFEERVSAVDGNVSRVYARIEGLRTDLNDLASKKAIRELGEKLLPEKRVGDFNQSLMELGALICLPHGKPHCGECPIADFCEARRTGQPENIPCIGKKTAVLEEDRTVFLLDDGSGFALRKRPATGLLAGTWEFPHVEGKLSLEESQTLLKEWGFRVIDIVPAGDSIHRFSHLLWRMKGYRIRVEGKQEGFLFATASDIGSEYALSKAFRFLQNQM